MSNQHSCRKHFTEFEICFPVLIWDDAKKQFVMEFTFSSPVLAIRLRRDRYAVLYSNETMIKMSNVLNFCPL